MTVLWDPYRPKSTSTPIDEDHANRSSSSSDSDSDEKHNNQDNHDNHHDDDDDVAFIAPDKWDYVYDIEVWHKKAVMDDDKSFYKQ